MLRGIALSAIKGDRRLFTGLDLALDPGELLYVNGPNGSGKTTLLRMLCGLVLPADGQILWEGQDIHSLGDEYRANLLYCGHHNAVKDDLNALENLRISHRLGGRDVSKPQARDALRVMGLQGLESLPAKFLSQGQRRRLSLARIVLTGARLWILDEPFTALDIHAVDLLRREIERHLQGGGLAVVTTHQRVSIAAAATRQISMGTTA
jgi:heme exporter protein A